MFPELKSTSESILYRPADGFMFLGHSTSMIQMEDGINEHGLAAGMNFLMTRIYKPGLNTGMIIRHILETCKTVAEAVAFIENAPISSTQNIILADKNGDMAVAECGPEKVYIRRPADNAAYLISANHFIGDGMQDEHANPEDNWYLSNDRYETVKRAFAEEEEKGISWAEDVLSGKKGIVCQYDKKMNFDTIWSVVYDVSNLKIFRAEGNPSKTKFKEDTRLAWGMNKK